MTLDQVFNAIKIGAVTWHWDRSKPKGRRYMAGDQDITDLIEPSSDCNLRPFILRMDNKNKVELLRDNRKGK